MYIRVVKRRAWLRLSQGVPGAVEEALGELVRHGPRASVFVCDSRADIELIAVAFSAGRRVKVETVCERELKRVARELHAAGQPIPAESWLLR